MANFNGVHEYDASVGDIYNAGGIYLARTTAVGSYQPNAWGLYDMHGNVYEWCWDWYGPYPAGSVTDPLGLSSGYNAHVTRGGAWYCAGEWYCGGGRCRAARRDGFDPAPGNFGTGFRVVLAPSQS
jgi:formylglycine-generating enzyme required for sulfatase activity